MRYQNSSWNRKLTNQYLVILAFVTGAALVGLAIEPLEFSQSIRIALAVALLVVSSGIGFQIVQRFGRVEARTEGDFLIVRNAFAAKRVPVNRIRPNSWQPFRSGGVTFTLIEFQKEDGNPGSLRVLAVPPSDAAEFFERLVLPG